MELGRLENTANPHFFTTRLADLAAERGADFVLGSANYVEEGSKSQVLESRNHGIVVRPRKTRIGGIRAIFPELHPKTPQKRDPARRYTPAPDGTIYSCGRSDTDVQLPEATDSVEVNPEICGRMYGDVSSISQAIREGEIITR
ncbi:MAG: hypothetical protein LQ345_003740 [Seirophora villosa]|nr:MAG: hypothetical protein LQ345_003740 [Seirophora villosa]